MWLRSTSKAEVDRCIALLVRRSRGAHKRLRKSRAVRYSGRPTRRSAEASRLLSCGCAHYRVQPDTARQLTTTQPPRGATERSQHPEGCQGCRCWQLSWSFLPLRRLSPGESTPPRFASPGTFRPQGFAPSRRLTPRPNARPCFMPETPMGFFALQGFSLTARSTGSSPLDCPRDVSPPHQHMVDARRPSPRTEARFTDLFRLQGVAPTVNPYHHLAVTPLAMADPLLSFSASPGSYPTLTGHVACYVCHSCASPCDSCLRSIVGKPGKLPLTASSDAHEQARVRFRMPSSVDHRSP
jgi:hypothetical protein